MHDATRREFGLATLDGRALWLSALLLVVAPWLIVAGSIAAQGLEAWRARGMGELIGPLVCGAVWAGVALASRRSRITLANGVLTVRSTFYRCDVPLSALDLDGARVFDREERTELGTARKRNGVGLPGFHSGHFRLRNGERAFVAVAAGRWRLWLPRRGGGGLLLEPDNARALLDMLRAATERMPSSRLAGVAGNG